jgi:hypothetical protein
MNESDDFYDNDLYGFIEPEPKLTFPHGYYNTFALRTERCDDCDGLIEGVGMYFNCIMLPKGCFKCLKCYELGSKKFFNSRNIGKRGVKLHGVLLEKLGNEIIEMLQAKALTN